MIHNLGTESVSNQLIAKAVLRLANVHALPYLQEALEADNRIAQRHAAAVIGDIGRAEAVPMLRAALALEDRDARAQVIDALRKVGDKTTTTVDDQIHDRDAEVRAAAARYLGATGDEGNRAVLRSALEQEKHTATSNEMLCAMLRLGDKRVAPQVLERFVTGEQLDRQAAEAALNETGTRLEASALDPREKRAAAAERWQQK
jgi:HEAT repeat protein